MTSQLFDDVFAEEPVQKAYLAVSDLIPGRGENPNYEEIHQTLSDFVLRVVEITSAADLPSRSNPIAWSNAATAFSSCNKPTIEEQAQLFQHELTTMGMPTDLPLIDLGGVVMGHTLQLMGR